LHNRKIHILHFLANNNSSLMCSSAFSFSLTCEVPPITSRVEAREVCLACGMRLAREVCIGYFTGQLFSFAFKFQRFSFQYFSV
ncbi:MAG TPA: hypothetical protein VIK28_06955, partial [Sedimentisphaerales bacterium]